MIIYQMALRTFTPEGTFRAAEARLEHVASLFVDVIYLCPFFRADADEDRTTWSPRQIASQTENPKNPYKIADYFHVDEEYGTDEDLISFVHRAHALGMKVIFDLVYLHCGKNAVFIKDNPNFVLQKEDGSPLVGESWPFARLNFENPSLRAYLYHNMETLVTVFDADGFRCDVGDEVPLDFWREAFSRLRAIKPHLLTINEGSKSEYLATVFDKTYGYWISPMRKMTTGDSVSCLRVEIEREKTAYGARMHDVLHGIENHDTASDFGLNRNEIEMTSRGVEAMMVICTLYSGTPFLWNGYELADRAENCMFSNRFHGKRSAMDWSCAFTRDGQRRLSFVRELHRLYHAYGVFQNGACEEIPSERPDDVFVFARDDKEEAVLVAVNCKNLQTEVTIPDRFALGNILLSSDAVLDGKKLALSAYGYLVLRVRNS